MEGSDPHKGNSHVLGAKTARSGISSKSVLVAAVVLQILAYRLAFLLRLFMIPTGSGNDFVEVSSSKNDALKWSGFQQPQSCVHAALGFHQVSLNPVS